MEVEGKRKDKVPTPGAKGEESTNFYSLKKWKDVLQETQLSLAGCSLGPRGCLVVSTALFKNTYVTMLDLSHNNLGDEGALTVANLLRVNTQLLHLNLSHNDISDVGGIAIASAFIPTVSATGQPGQWNRSLFSLHLIGNNFTEDTLLALSNATAAHRDLTLIDLAWNKVGPDGPRCLLRALERNPLCVYQLAANDLGDEGTAHLCDAILQFGGRTQTSLNLYRNSISDAGADAVGRLIVASTALQDVSLAGNTIGFKGAEALQQRLTDSSVVPTCTLRFLNLSDNWLGDEGAACVAAIIAADLPGLERLDVSDNQITDTGATVLMQALLLNTHLLQVNCDGNTLGPRAVTAVVHLIKQSATLKSISVAGCIQSAEQRRMLSVAVGERDGLHVELGPNPREVSSGGGEEEGVGVGAELEEKLLEYLEVAADQAAQANGDAPVVKKKKKGKKIKGKV